MQVTSGFVRWIRLTAVHLNPRPVVDAVWLDTRLSLRVSRKHPGLTVVIVAALAFGIPVSLVPVHIVNIVDAALPVPGGERIVALRYWDRASSRPVEPRVADYFRWRDALAHVETIGAAGSFQVNVSGEGDAPLPLTGSVASASLFEILRVPPLLGRPLLGEDEATEAQDVVVLGYDAWQSLTGGDPGIVGKQVRLTGAPHTVVGVMPEGFTFPWQDQFWVPLRPFANGQQDARLVQVIGRLAEGASRDEAEAEFLGVAGRVPRDASDAPDRYRGEVVPVVRAALGIPRGTSVVVAVAQMVSLIMLALACGCVGVLVLARTMTRLREFSIRAAVGASRTRIVGQLFTETILLALVATGLGLLIADRVAAAWQPLLAGPGTEVPTWLDFGVNVETAATALALGLFSAVFTGVLPGLRATAGDPYQGLLNDGLEGAGVRFGVGTMVLIPAMVALTICCLGIGTALVPGLFGDRTEGIGIRASEFLAAEFWAPPPSRPGDGVEPDPGISVQEVFLRRLQEEPGVRGVTFGHSLPGTSHRPARIEVEGQEGTVLSVRENPVYPGFFRGLGHEVAEGRSFVPEDQDNPRHPVIVNDRFVERVLVGRSPIGVRFRHPAVRNGASRAATAGEWFEVVGVVGTLGVDRSGPAQGAAFYRPVGPSEGEWIRLAVEVGANPTRMTRRVRALLAEVSPRAMLRSPTALSEVPDPNDLERRLWTALMGIVIGVAGLLGVAGLHALVAFTVQRRTLEIGIRRALGAESFNLAFVVARRAALQLALGVTAGAALGFLGIQWFAGRVWADAPDWSSILAALVAGALLMGLLSCLVPILRGLRIEPSAALRAGK